MSPRWIVVVALFAVATLLAVVAGRLRRRGEGFMSYVIAVGLASQVVIPDFWRAIVLAVFAFVVMLAIGAPGIGALLRLATTFEIWAWSAWGASCAAIATLQFAGIV